MLRLAFFAYGFAAGSLFAVAIMYAYNWELYR